jgi:hypothetical protein
VCLNRTNDTAQLAASSAGQLPESAQDAELRGIVVRANNGALYELSSTFRPDTADYGASVPQTFASGILCLDPEHGWLLYSRSCPVLSCTLMLVLLV